MGHKVHPVGFRLGVIRNWDAKWYADKHFVTYLQEDLKVRKAIKDLYPEAGVSQVEIDRQANNVTLTIHTARPGILIGRGGQRVDDMRKMLEKVIGKKVQLNIREIQQPELDAFLVARNIADQMERRVSYRRAMKQTMQRTIQAGAKGMRIRCAGRLDGAEIARKIIMHEGRVPLHTIRADIDYGFTEARTVMGRIGVKVWLYKGEILPEKEEATAAAPAATGENMGGTSMAEELASATSVTTEAVKAETSAVEKPKTVRRAARPKTEAPKAEETPAATTETKAKPVKKPVVHHTKPAPETPAESTVSTEEKKAPVRKPRATTAKAKDVKGSAEQGDSNATT
jgi:small subunit ribosomal protein S3